MIISSVRPVIYSIRRMVRAVPGSSRVRSRVRYRTTGNACLVSDVQMPGMTGLELHKHLVDMGHRIPTILVTAYPDDLTRNRALRDGVVCYVGKRVDDEHLEHCIRSALQSKSPDKTSS